MQWPNGVLAVLRALYEAGHDAWAVGGCVRDALLGRTPNDWDVCTSATPPQMLAALGEFRLIETGLRHGTITALAELPIEVTTYRVDGVYTDHRHPDGVRFVSELAKDLARRDFTVNAMAMRPDKPLVDLFGGREDLRRRLVKCVGRAELRFSEDALRMLRALRFASQLDFSIEEHTSRALRKGWAALDLVSAERVYSEWTRLLRGPGAGRVLADYAAQLGAIAPMREIDPHSLDLLPPDPVLRMALLLLDEKPLPRLRADNASLRRLALLVSLRERDLPRTRPEALRLLREAGPEGARDLLLLRRAEGQATKRAEALLTEALADGACYRLCDLAVRGNDLADLGLYGPQIGQTLDMLLEKVMDGGLPNDREALRNYLIQR